MQTEAFERGLAELRVLAKAGRIVLLCAEAVPWRRHRSLVADVLMSRGAEVEDIIGSTHSSEHRMTPFAKVSRGH